MEKVTLTIEDFEDKKAQSGKRYTRFKTSDGWMSAFDKGLIDELKSHEGEEIVVQIAVDEDKGFKNLRKFIKVADDEDSDEDEEDEKKPYKKPAAALKESFPVSMMVSYAKDLFVSMAHKISPNENCAEDLMTQCIMLIAKAKTMFENPKLWKEEIVPVIKINNTIVEDEAE